MAADHKMVTPMSEFEDEEIIEINESLAEKFSFEPSFGGKWMLFYEKEYIDKMWKEAVSLYRAGELHGIVSVRTSTAADCARAGDSDKGVIRFMCGPWDDEDLILQYGLNLIKKMKYFSNYGYVAYKTDVQSQIGANTTGDDKNYLYRLSVATHDHEENWSGSCSECPIEVPSCTLHKIYLQEALLSAIVQMSDPIELGKFAQWRLTFKMGPLLDSSWTNACRLYRQGQLDGIVHLTSTTIKCHSSTGVIAFYCDSKQSSSRLKAIGSNLVRLFQYSGRDGSVRCTCKTVNGSGWEVLCRVQTL